MISLKLVSLSEAASMFRLQLRYKLNCWQNTKHWKPGAINSLHSIISVVCTCAVIVHCWFSFLQHFEILAPEQIDVTSKDCPRPLQFAVFKLHVTFVYTFDKANHLVPSMQRKWPINPLDVVNGGCLFTQLYRNKPHGRARSAADEICASTLHRTTNEYPRPPTETQTSGSCNKRTLVASQPTAAATAPKLIYYLPSSSLNRCGIVWMRVGLMTYLTDHRLCQTWSPCEVLYIDRQMGYQPSRQHPGTSTLSKRATLDQNLSMQNINSLLKVQSSL